MRKKCKREIARAHAHTHAHTHTHTYTRGARTKKHTRTPTRTQTSEHATHAHKHAHATPTEFLPQQHDHILTAPRAFELSRYTPSVEKQHSGKSVYANGIQIILSVCVQLQHAQLVKALRDVLVPDSLE